MNTKIATGHCYCGSVSFEISGEPVKVAYCHCESCRRSLGGIVTASAGFRPDQVVFTDKEPSAISTEYGVTRTFCGDCGSSVSYTRDASEFVFVYLGLFDDPNRFIPQVHMMYSEKAEWLSVDEHLPKADDFA